MARDVFVSYHSADSAPANRLSSFLERSGISCWIAPRDVPPGQAWPTAILEGIRRCHVLLLVLSANSKNSKQISREVEIADKNGLRIVTFRLEDVSPPESLEYFLANLQWIDGFGTQFDAAARKLIETVRLSARFPAAPTVVWIAGGTNSPLSLQNHALPASQAESVVARGSEPAETPGWRKRTAYLLMAGVLVALALAATAYYWLNTVRKKEEVDKALQNGIQALGRNDDAAAVTYFKRALELDPGNAKALGHCAEAYYRQGNDSLALLDVNQAIQIEGASACETHLVKAEVLKALRQNPEALKEYDAFLASHPIDQHAIQTAVQGREQLANEMSLQATADTWLRQVDWKRILPKRTQELGTFLERNFDRCEKAPEGDCVCYYDSSFSKVPSVTERVVLIKNADGKWQGNGYGYTRK